MSPAKAKTSSNSKLDGTSSGKSSVLADKRASKVASNTQRAGKVTPSKQDAKGKAVAPRDGAHGLSQQEHFKHPAQPSGYIHPAAGLAPTSTQGSVPVDYFGAKGALAADGQEQQQRRAEDNSSDLDALRYRAANSEDEDDEVDGADADASIRPITPSSIDASSSFTGSTSLHSLAPTSRTFKSFRTGHSKASASTKPTLLGPNGTSINAPSAAGCVPAGNAPSISSPTSDAPPALNETSTSPPNSVHSINNQRRDGTLGQAITIQSDKQKEKGKSSETSVDASGGGSSSLGIVDMHDPDANRIATSLHNAEGIIPSSPRSARTAADLPVAMALQPSPLHSARQGPRASPLRNSFVGPISGLAVPPALSSAEEESENGSQIPQQSTPRGTEWAEVQSENDGERLDSLHMPEAHRVDSSSNVISSAASITFSKLPPATPSSISSAQLYSAPGSPGRLSSYTNQHSIYRESEEGDENIEGIYHYPRHSAPDPRNNPRASSPPPDNASMLTLASSTGGRAPSVYTAASRYRDGFAGGSGGGSGSIGGAPSIVDTAGHRYRTTANEDASIRAIAPSRRESTDSIGSKWSAVVLSQREGSYHAPTAITHAGAAAGEMTPDNASYKRKTPSLRTVATTASSYNAAPIAPSTELKA